MPITSYKLIKGASNAQLSQLVQLELSQPNRTLVYQPWSRGGYLCQGVGVGTIDVGKVTGYMVITHGIDENFQALVNTNLPYYQPIGSPVIHNSALYQVMGTVDVSQNMGAPGRTPQIRLAAGFIQWKYEDEVYWTNLVALTSITGPGVELQVFENQIQWKWSNSPYWERLIELDSLKGPANKLSIGTVTTGDTPAATITGSAPNQTLNLTLPKGDTGPANTLSIGSVTTVSPSSPASVSITGNAPNQTVNFNIPSGPSNTLSIGTVTSGTTASATITGNAPEQILNLTLPRGTNAVMELISGTVTTAGTPVPLTFTKTYSAPPVVIPVPQWNGSQMITGGASDVTATGCNFRAVQSRGTLLLTSGPFENAAAGQTFRVLVIGN